MPLYQMVGADPQAMPPTSFTIGIDEPEVMAERALEAGQFLVLKVKLGTGRDRERVEVIRRRTSVPIRVDVNEGWRDPEAAIREIEWLARRGVELVEQPLPARMAEEMVWLKARSPLPLMADESVCHPGDLAWAGEGFHGINVKLMKCGGILPALASRVDLPCPGRRPNGDGGLHGGIILRPCRRRPLGAAGRLRRSG